ncbi:MAG: GNAT family N-acetyltransferase [Candidatus Eisenbacteria bacterium]|uniref:GNAT family N-acetyltransferase n=1 Tax=Eiseniibacteriota bacterium TaxID=2212470 RepID=A0A937X6T9_UNCEI|nr:GNAT family N-acetyltransferase [Candidatus Eisenbacteria bacterium]
MAEAARRGPPPLRTRDGLARLEPAGDEAYERLLAGRPEATFFHTRTWARIVARAFPHLEDCSGILSVEGRPHALPLFRWSRWRGLSTTLHSGFPFLYGGPVPADATAWRACLALLADSRAAVTLIGNPLAPPLAETDPPAGLSLRDEETHLLALPESIEAYRDSILSPRKRSYIRRLAREGVFVEPTRSAEDLAAVYGLYRRRMAAWEREAGFVYPIDFYRAMLEIGGDAVRLYAARREGRLIGGAFIVRWNGCAHYCTGFYDDQARDLRPNLMIQEKVIGDAIADGFRRYDFLPSAGLAGVEAFKASLGGELVPFPRWERSSPVQRWARVARALLRRGPGRERHGDA